jgi:CheY-like chemotaxis protein
VQSVRVLVAEDNEDHLFLTVRALHSVEGIELEVEGVRDGEEALDYMHRRGEYADRKRPHLFVVDLKMPRRSGFEVIDELKSDPQLRRIPIVVLTSSDDSEDVKVAYQLGTNSYVAKPASTTDFQEGVREIATYWADYSLLPQPPA